jgi:hypothetical protein
MAIAAFVVLYCTKTALAYSGPLPRRCSYCQGRRRRSSRHQVLRRSAHDRMFVTLRVASTSHMHDRRCDWCTIQIMIDMLPIAPYSLPTPPSPFSPARNPPIPPFSLYKFPCPSLGNSHFVLHPCTPRPPPASPLPPFRTL